MNDINLISIHKYLYEYNDCFLIAIINFILTMIFNKSYEQSCKLIFEFTKDFKESIFLLSKKGKQQQGVMSCF